ncbi:PolC-type DNA polymerase III [Oscillibacter hominis]|uniref:DNA polymerase III PolC-type n=1 Tax=Oscillibacter hominis TaxID=2763056 RepID=A0A7G9B7G7_9FIRM|nr:PolC-type DNA polymerase III [Oscillibacter hominis]QNL45498.1 PolC-type DNA polymerase III [Oscillibacter hominis]
MAQKIPFFDMFADLTPPRELHLKLYGSYLSGAVIDQSLRSITLQLVTEVELCGKEISDLQEMIARVYGFSEVKIDASCQRPAPKSNAKSGAKGGKAPSQILLGSVIKGSPVPMEGLNPKMGTVTVEGKVFFADCHETRRPGVWSLSFDMTDFQNSVTVRKMLRDQEVEQLKDAISPGMWLRVQGKMELTYDGRDVQLNPYCINVVEHAQRQDTAPDKRVELHLHTKMSNMDALTDTKEVVKEAIRWGHPAIAITDHGVAQSFPDAAKAAGDKIKVIYGVEGYFINNLDDRIAIHGTQRCAFDGEFVCFDIETTGLKVMQEAITEIGAVVLRNGEVCERFQTFVNPNRRLTPEIVGLTGITDDMLRDAPQLKEALSAFLNFVDGRPLAAHNAEFDISFIREGCRRVGLPFQPTYVDSLILAQNLLPELGKYKLDIVAEALKLPAFNHHRASDDAATVAYMLIPFFEMLKGKGLSDIQEVNSEMARLRPLGKKVNRQPKHIILLAKNKAGLKNLYQLISASNLKYFKRVPTIPKSELIAHREGLIIGSACEAGELFRAVVDHKDWDELKRIASFYDYLEIQPLCNNQFMLRNGTVRTEEELREFNRTICRLGEELGKPVCATGDVHFQEPEDEVYRHILLASKKFPDANEPLPIYFKTTDEMLREFSYLGEEKALEVVVKNPQAIADQVEVIELLPKGQLFPPRLENSEEDLNRLVWEKVHALYGENPPQLIVDRLNVELGGILGKYDVVYMSAQKLVQRSLENGYLVGSRGSVGSSLVAYMSGITEVNSLPPHYRCPKCRHSEFIQDGSYGCGADMPDKMCPVCGEQYVKDGFDIPFETFLGFGGGKVPDIDLNFSGEYQAKAHRHAIEMFGETQVFRAGTIGTLAEKTAYGFVKKYLEENGMSAGRAEENRLTLGCVGTRRTTGQHPGGLVVVPDDMDIEDFCPVQHPADDPNSDTVTTHFEYHCMEDNLLKLDMLGHDDPTMVRMMQDLTGVDPHGIPLDDPDTMSIFTSSKVLGYEDDEILGPTGAVAIPEFNTRFTRQMLVDTQPKDFNTLVRLSGFSHGTDVWLGNARELIVSGTASVLETVGCRDDIMLYLISKGLEAKMSFKIMESVRKGKVKKNGFEDGWVEAMESHGVPAWYIDSLAKIGYLFPKAHAVAYVMMAFRIAWYKVHEPLAFYATFFSVRAKAFDAEYCCAGLDAVKKKIREIENNKDATAVEQDLLTTLEVCYEFYLRGFHFDTINIYESDATKFKVVENGLLPPFTSVHGLGEAAALDTVEKRKGKHFISIEEFSMCCNKLSKTHIEQLRGLGAFAGMAETSQITLF